MRVLLTTRGSSGHVLPLAPFGHACLRAGHAVLVAAQDHFEANVARTGLPFAPVGAPRAEDWMPLLPEFARLRLDEGHARMVAEFFGGIDVRAMLPGLRRVADEWRPDLIVRESWEYGSTIVAEERGIRSHASASGSAESRTCRSAPSSRPCNGSRGAGLPADAEGERLRAAPYFTDMPLALEDPAEPSPPRTLPSDGGRPGARRAQRRAAPLRELRLGHRRRHLPFYPALYRAVIEALAPLPARVLLTVGEARDHDELGPLPENVHVERWAPQADLLPRVAAVVTHGGHGSVLGALAHGVPVVVLPLFSLDQWFNAAAVARTGSGVALDTERHTRRAIDMPSAETLAGLRPAVEHVLGDPAPRRAAEGLPLPSVRCRPWTRPPRRSSGSPAPPVR